MVLHVFHTAEQCQSQLLCRNVMVLQGDDLLGNQDHKRLEQRRFACQMNIAGVRLNGDRPNPRSQYPGSQQLLSQPSSEHGSQPVGTSASSDLAPQRELVVHGTIEHSE